MPTDLRRTKRFALGTMCFALFVLLVGAPISFLTVRYTAPHHVEERQRTAAALEATEEAGA